MYKVLIVDDERLIRKSIRNRLDWAHCGVEICGEAANGEEALRTMQNESPDIVLTDIRMPLMDGLALIEKASVLCPRTKFIIMSAYSDFDYAKQAIRLGVEDYILKPVKVKELEEVVRKIVHSLDEKKLQQHLRENRKGNINAKLKGQKIGAMAFYIDNQEEIETRIEKALGAEIESYYLQGYSRGDCYVFLAVADELQEEALRRLIRQVWEEMPNLTGTCAYSEIGGPEDIHKAARQSVYLLMRKMFYPERRIISIRQSAGVGRLETQKKIRSEINYLYQAAIKKDYDNLKKAMAYVVNLIVHQENHLGVIQSSIAELVQIMRMVIGESEDEMETNIYFHPITGKDYLLRYHTADELKSVLMEVVDHVFCSRVRDQDSNVIDAIKEYIHDNYEHELNANDIAEKFYINTSYLSSMFKAKTGINMGKYIEDVRMEKAKAYIANKDWTITEVASRSGYADSGYFSRVFKKYTGRTPKQYREELERED